MSANPSIPQLTSILSLNDFRISIGRQPAASTARTDSTFQEGSDDPNDSRVSWDDPTWKIIPAALKKYQHGNYYHDDSWENYAMLIYYGPPNDRTEMCLSYDEKPLLVYQKLRNAEKHPVFVLKHIKDIPSPIAAARRRRSTQRTSRNVSTEIKPNDDLVNVLDSVSESAIVSGAQTPVESLKSLLSTIIPASAGRGAKREMPPPLNVVSYAVAIYPYVAEQEDEFDVAVGDTFVIISRLYDWLVAQRDPTGVDIVGANMSIRGWVPDGCFLETVMPVASAIAEAMAFAPSNTCARAPILPRSIVSSNFPGVALMDYKMKAEEEMDLVKGDSMRIFKVYDHWCYAVKETGNRGWVPSWLVGKVPRILNTNSTSATSNALMLGFGDSN